MVDHADQQTLGRKYKRNFDPASTALGWFTDILGGDLYVFWSAGKSVLRLFAGPLIDAAHKGLDKRDARKAHQQLQAAREEYAAAPKDHTAIMAAATVQVLGDLAHQSSTRPDAKQLAEARTALAELVGRHGDQGVQALLGRDAASISKSLSAGSGVKRFDLANAIVLIAERDARHGNRSGHMRLDSRSAAAVVIARDLLGTRSPLSAGSLDVDDDSMAYVRGAESAAAFGLDRDAAANTSPAAVHEARRLELVDAAAAQRAAELSRSL